MLPEEVRKRRDKQGMIAPTEHWFRGENRDEVREVLGLGRARGARPARPG